MSFVNATTTLLYIKDKTAHISWKNSSKIELKVTESNPQARNGNKIALAFVDKAVVVGKARWFM